MNIAKGCPECLDTGFVGDNRAGKRGNNEYVPCECEKGKQIAGEINKKVSDLTISELYELIIKAIRECKRQDTEISEAEYQKLTGGKVPKEY